MNNYQNVYNVELTMMKTTVTNVMEVNLKIVANVSKVIT